MTQDLDPKDASEQIALLKEANEQLLARLQAAEATLDAIRDGSVDAVVVEGLDEKQHIFTLESADLPFRRFLEHMGEGAVSLDAAGVLQYCNGFFAQLVGHPQEVLMGTQFETYLGRASVDTFRVALHANDIRHLALELMTAHGRAIPVQVALTVVAGVGEERRINVVVTDLSERERIRELRAARQAAEMDILAKENFLATVGHDLRAPLNVVLGWAGILLQGGELGDKTRKAISTIERNARLQGKLLDDLVDISRFSSGKMSVERVQLDLSELVRAAVQALSLGATENGIDLTAHTEGSVMILGDAARLEQVLQNLIGNALKFTARGGHVSVQVKRNGDCAQVLVQDDGRGIEPALLSKVFQPFRQASIRNAREKGLGLGLAISKSLVELHDGTVSAASDGVGLGSTFTVELPLLDENTPISAMRTGEFSPQSLQGIRVLVVDDEDDAREMTVRVLRSYGAELVAVSDAAAALARLQRESFDVVVSDLVMPGTSGFDMVREIVSRHTTTVGLLAFSSLSVEEGRAAAEHAGFQAYLRKPSEPDILCSVVLGLIPSAVLPPKRTRRSRPHDRGRRASSAAPRSPTCAPLRL